NPPTLIRKARYRGIFFAQIPQSFTQYVADGWIPCPIRTDPRGRLRCCALSPAAVTTGNWFSTCAIDQRMQADAGNPDQMRMALNGEEAGISGRRGSNPQPSAWEADALPLSYCRRGDTY